MLYCYIIIRWLDLIGEPTKRNNKTRRRSNMYSNTVQDFPIYKEGLSVLKHPSIYTLLQSLPSKIVNVYKFAYSKQQPGKSTV